MKVELQELNPLELTPEEKAFSAGYHAAENLWYRMAIKGISPESAEEFINDVGYDTFIAAMDKYFTSPT